jgi:hypothetical protein
VLSTYFKEVLHNTWVFVLKFVGIVKCVRLMSCQAEAYFLLEIT